jgi:hypothetical protein
MPTRPDDAGAGGGGLVDGVLELRHALRHAGHLTQVIADTLGAAVPGDGDDEGGRSVTDAL